MKGGREREGGRGREGEGGREGGGGGGGGGEGEREYGQFIAVCMCLYNYFKCSH